LFLTAVWLGVDDNDDGDRLLFETHFSLGVVSHKLNPQLTAVKTRPSCP
jgi:hypothetical protein